MSSSSKQPNLPEIRLKKPSSGVNQLIPSHSKFQKAKVANLADKGTLDHRRSSLTFRRQEMGCGTSCVEVPGKAGDGG